jgi:hypothetical protein
MGAASMSDVAMEVERVEGGGAAGGHKEFTMPDCNPFLRRAIYERLETVFMFVCFFFVL